MGGAPGTPVIAPAALPAGVVGKAYSAVLTASGVGRRAHWIVLSGDLPAGLVLDQKTGTISGTPASTGSAGATIGVSVRGGPVGAASFSIAVTAS